MRRRLFDPGRPDCFAPRRSSFSGHESTNSITPKEETYKQRKRRRHSPRERDCGSTYLLAERLIHSSSSIISTPSSRALASFEPAPGPATTRSVFAEIEPDTFAPSRSAMRLRFVARHPFERTGEDDGLAGERMAGRDRRHRLDRHLLRAARRARPRCAPRRRNRRLPRRPPGRCPRWPPSSSAAPGSRAAARKWLPITEMAGEPARVGLADVADAEREQEPVQRDPRAARRWRRRDCAPTSRRTLPIRARAAARSPSRALKRENVGRRPDQALLEEKLDLLVAEALDVEGVARAEMLQALDRLRRADEMRRCSGARRRRRPSSRRSRAAPPSRRPGQISGKT